MDFEKEAECVKEINTFAENSTNGKIKEVITEKDLEGEITAVLINAVYFKGQWDNFFTKRFKDTFKSNPPREIDYIHRTIFHKWYYNKGKDCESVGIPYKNRDVWMYIIVPKQEDGLSKLIEKMDAKLFGQCTKPKTAFLNLDIPAFEITKSIDLKQNLEQMGIKQVFSLASDLGNMTHEATTVGKILHKATINVDEYGTEASGATASVMTPRSIPIHVHVDRPFLYFITVNEKHTEKRGDSKWEETLTNPKKVLFAGTFC